MSKQTQTSLKKVRTLITAAYIVFVLLMLFWCIRAHEAAKQGLSTLANQKARLSRLNEEIKSTQKSIDRLKAEQAEFKKLLFNDRDVPAFIDGVSHSAASTSVYITDMKTQSFARIVVPKDVSADASNLEKHRAYDFDDDNKKAPKQELTQMLTLAAMPIHIKIQGHFADIVHFLNALESERQLLTISNVDIERGRDYPYLNCEFMLRIYSLQQLKDIKK